MNVVVGGIMKRAAKQLARCFAVSVMFPIAALTGFGRNATMFQLFAQAVALAPGKPGDYLRVAYYFMTLREASLSMQISFGSFFAHSSASVKSDVYIGAYCVLGNCSIGERTQVATHVQILSGKRQHSHNTDGRILGSRRADLCRVRVGADCWIGASAIVMCDVGPHSTVGAGAVVTREVPAGCVAVGVPARVISEVHA